MKPWEIPLFVLLAALVVLAALKFRSRAKSADALLLAGMLGAAVLLALITLDPMSVAARGRVAEKAGAPTPRLGRLAQR